MVASPRVCGDTTRDGSPWPDDGARLLRGDVDPCGDARGECARGRPCERRREALGADGNDTHVGDRQRRAFERHACVLETFRARGIGIDENGKDRQAGCSSPLDAAFERPLALVGTSAAGSSECEIQVGIRERFVAPGTQTQYCVCADLIESVLDDRV